MVPQAPFGQSGSSTLSVITLNNNKKRGEVMPIEYEMTFEDYKMFAEYHHQHSPTTRRLMQWWVIAIPIIMFGAVLITVPFVGFSPFLTVFAVLFSIFWIFRFPRVFKKNLAKNIDKMLKEGENKAVIGKKILTIDDAGVKVVSEYGESRTTWEGIEKCAVSEECIYLYIGAANAYVVPKRIFSSQEECEKTIEMIRGKINIVVA